VAGEGFPGGKVFAWPSRVFPAATSYQGAAEVKKLLKK